MKSEEEYERDMVWAFLGGMAVAVALAWAGMQAMEPTDQELKQMRQTLCEEVTR